jgi:hypothetical protein
MKKGNAASLILMFGKAKKPTPRESIEEEDNDSDESLDKSDALEMAMRRPIIRNQSPGQRSDGYGIL